ncbi:MAG: FCD domain-containing protein [Hyphomicrobiales bacterium]|nr:FCD domain-containing protein [Hyphomicrobiales bacterium]
MTLVQREDAAAEPTISAMVFRQIRADIVACRLAPSERLRVEDLRLRYGVGGGPIREALMRLEAEGLATLEQNKGFRVSPVSREQLLDLMHTRIEIEAIALRWSIEKGGIEWEADLLAAFHRLSHLQKTDRTRAGSVSTPWFNEHKSFHAALVAACDSPKLVSIREALFDQAERYVALSIISRYPTRNDIAEHEQIMRATLARNVSRAVQLHSAHIERTAERVAKSLGEARTPRLRTSNGKDVR